MRELQRSKTWTRVVRAATAGVAILLLAGCATGYSFVQPDVAGSGGYYTSAGSYPAQGYYGVDPYYFGAGGYYPDAGWYPGTSGWYGGYGYGSGLTFSLGISSGWGFPGYGWPWYSGWGFAGYGWPWYSSGYPVWNCAGPGCGYWRYYRHSPDSADQDAANGLLPGTGHHPFVPPPRRPWNRVPPIALESHVSGRLPAADFLNRQRLDSRAFAPHELMRAPLRARAEEGFNGLAVRPAYVDRVPVESAFAGQRALPLPAPVRGMAPMPRPAFQPAPMPAAPLIAPPSRNGGAHPTAVP